jgi:predicted GH43/DUF377 family glycosyl hydrolase
MVERTVDFGNGETAKVSLERPVARYPLNPVLTAEHVNAAWKEPGWKVTTVHNAGVTRHDGETLMLFRSHLRCGVSVLGVARSSNGVDGWRVDPAPALTPAGENERGGVEDPRIHRMGGAYAVTYSAYRADVKNRVQVCLALTEDFKTFKRLGPMLERDMRNVVLFDQAINGRYAALFRPNDVKEGDVGGIYTQIRIGYSMDWKSNEWEIADEPVMRTGFGPSAFSDKIGPGAPPLKTDRGWLNLFHGVRSTMDGNPYVLGVALHDLEDPARVKVSSIPILFPSRADCRVKEEDYVHVPNVVFTCGALAVKDEAILILYGGNDTVMNVGATHADVLVALCERFGQDPLSGRLLYEPGK